MATALVITGPPCAGKSTLAAALAARLRWPLLAKDAYKEQVFERLGVGDRGWSRRVSLLAWDLLLGEAGRLLAAGADGVLEGNFREPQRHALAALGAAAGARLVEVRVAARAEVLLARFRERAGRGERHPGHVDLEALPEIERELAAAPAALTPLGAGTLDWDTSDGFDVGPLLAALERRLAA
ncbi:MAG: AAA family ATPase [Proteobacteria bacterium]|nr:AAA family ATPase [Pseudomonadota bacterium]